jgi:predicted RNA-binding protein YlqC (UPF0109 family)
VSRAKDVVEVIARALVDQRDLVDVTESERRDGPYVEVRTAEGDLGKMIGRQGRTATAIRALAGITAELEGQRATVDFLDEDGRG